MRAKLRAWVNKHPGRFILIIFGTGAHLLAADVILVNVEGWNAAPKTTAAELRDIRTAVAYLPHAPGLEVKIASSTVNVTATVYSSKDASAILSEPDGLAIALERVNGILFGKFTSKFWSIKAPVGPTQGLTPSETAIAKTYSDRWLQINVSSDFYSAFDAFLTLDGQEFVRLLEQPPNTFTNSGTGEGCTCTQFVSGANKSILLSDSSPWRIYQIQSGSQSWNLIYVPSRRLQAPPAAPTIDAAFNAIFFPG